MTSKSAPPTVQASGQLEFTITVTNNFATFVTQLPTAIVAATPAHHFVATGVYNRGNNTFTASSIDVVN